MSFKHHEIDQKWQGQWSKAQCFKAKQDSAQPKYYALDMFPYPSGAGLHVGHIASYTPSDVVSRYKRTKGFNVLHPMGYDAFGLPAEQYAIQTGIHPAVTTEKAIVSFRRTLTSFGFSFDWDREISSCEPKYYKWTQFIFLKLFEKGLAYQKEVPVNWCPALRTVLANEEVVDGRSERGGHPVVRLPMKQWMLKITDYAERLLTDLDKLDWPEKTKEGQRNWIGKSKGATISFEVAGHTEQIEVFTTRPDTLFGATFLVLAPEHPLVDKLTSAAQAETVKLYRAQVAAKSEVDRKAATDKTGVWIGAQAIHPFSKAQVPIWIADYVLMEYGLGAIMAVPAHDERDFAFAQKFALEIRRVVSGGELPYMGDGELVASEFLNGLGKDEAIERMSTELEAKGLGKRQVQYKLRDWLFSRQRYWGEPFPLFRDKSGQILAVSYDELPVALPEVADYEPSEKGEAPLARAKEWVNYKGLGSRETDTMPGSAGSSWYFLRYTDPHNEAAPFAFEAQKYWMPVDLYVGGPEHTVGHLLYARFWQKVLFDVGLVSHDEPFQKLFHQGIVQAPDGQRMSKSRGNVIPADEVRDGFGADAVRIYICFMGPPDKDKNWSVTGIEGVRRFLDRLWRLVVSDSGESLVTDDPAPEELERLLHKTIKKVGDDIENLSLNTAISTMMILVNEIYRLQVRPRATLQTLAQLLMPFGPHLAEELWQRLGGAGLVSVAPWPSFNPDLLKRDIVTVAVQVNGKTRGTIEVGVDADQESAVAAAMQINSVKQAMNSQSAKKIIYKPGKIINLIV